MNRIFSAHALRRVSSPWVVGAVLAAAAVVGYSVSEVSHPQVPTSSAQQPGRVIAAAGNKPGVAGTYRNPQTGLSQRVVADTSQIAVLIGDSQSAGAAGVTSHSTWPYLALNSLGYTVSVNAVGGTGYVAANTRGRDYPDAVESNQFVLPYSPKPKTLPLVVLEGGGNDAALKASDTQITDNAGRLLNDVRKIYPGARVVMIGTLGRGVNDGGGRRSEVDALLQNFASAHGVDFVSAGDWLTTLNLTGQLADKVHMRPAGHQVLAAHLAEELRKIGVTGPQDPAEK